MHFWKRFFIPTIFLILVFGIKPIKAQKTEPCPSDSKRAMSLVKKAKSASRSGEANKALNLYMEATEEDESYALPYYKLGMICRNRAQKDLMNREKWELLELKYHSKLVEICPEYKHKIYFNLGILGYKYEKFEEAEKFFELYLEKPELIPNLNQQDEASYLLEHCIFLKDIYANQIAFKPVLVKGVSTDKDEYRFILSPDNEIALFTRKIELSSRKGAFESIKKYKERLIISHLKQQEFEGGKPLEDPFNKTDHESGSLTIDNRLMYVMICKMKSSYFNCDICVTENRDGFWSDLENLGQNVNNDSTWEAQPSISSDGNMLLFTSDRAGGHGGYDIYKSIKDEEGNWGPAINLGPKVNTAGHEMSPFIHLDRKTLYFASSDRIDANGDIHRGQMGIGGYDIFYVKMDNGSIVNQPKNLGYPINSIEDDIAFFVSTNGKVGYFASNKLGEGHGWDIYSFDLHEEARPDQMLFIKGDIKEDEYEAPVTDAKVEIKNVNTKKITEIPVNQDNGKYVAVLPFQNDYILTVKKKNAMYETKYISKKNVKYDIPVKIDFEIKPIEVGRPYRLDDVHFATNSDSLTEDSELILDNLIEFLQENMRLYLSIHGHTDDVGDQQSNLILSDKRARSVHQYLVSNGVSSTRLQSKGFGETKPLDTNETEAGRANNRRTEFVILRK